MAKFQRSPHWIYQVLGEETQGLLVPLVASKADLTCVLQLNESASLLWEALEAPLALPALLEKMKPLFESMSDLDANWERQLRDCLDFMEKERVVVRVSP